MGETRVGYLNHIEVEDDPNAFPMGILLSKKIPTELLKYLKFPVFIRRRNDYKTGKDLSEYASFVHQQLNKLEDIHGIIEEETEQKAEQPATKTGMEPERRRTGQRAHVADECDATRLVHQQRDLRRLRSLPDAQGLPPIFFPAAGSWLHRKKDALASSG